MHFTDLKGKKRRDGFGSPDKASTPSVSCEGFQQDAESQKRPIINEEILALQIKEDDLLKVRLFQKLNIIQHRGMCPFKSGCYICR